MRPSRRSPSGSARFGKVNIRGVCFLSRWPAGRTYVRQPAAVPWRRAATRRTARSKPLRSAAVWMLKGSVPQGSAGRSFALAKARFVTVASLRKPRPDKSCDNTAACSRTCRMARRRRGRRAAASRSEGPQFVHTGVRFAGCVPNGLRTSACTVRLRSCISRRLWPAATSPPDRTQTSTP